MKCRGLTEYGRFRFLSTKSSGQSRGNHMYTAQDYDELPIKPHLLVPNLEFNSQIVKQPFQQAYQKKKKKRNKKDDIIRNSGPPHGSPSYQLKLSTINFTGTYLSGPPCLENPETMHRTSSAIPGGPQTTTVVPPLCTDNSDSMIRFRSSL